jgi:hypothetical protein
LTGISEILVLVLLIASILILPRMFKGGESPVKKKASSITLKGLAVKTRFGIILTLMYPIAMGLYLRPWNGNLVPFLAMGILPVFLAWALVWVLAGRRK